MPTPTRRGGSGAAGAAGGCGGSMGTSEQGVWETTGAVAARVLRRRRAARKLVIRGQASRRNQLLGPTRRGQSATRGRTSADGKTSSRLPRRGYPRHVVEGRNEHTSRRGRHPGFRRRDVSPAGPAAEPGRSARPAVISKGRCVNPETPELVAALLRRPDLSEAGRAALRQAFPDAPPAMLSAAVFHVFTDGVGAAA